MKITVLRYLFSYFNSIIMLYLTCYVAPDLLCRIWLVMSYLTCYVVSDLLCRIWLWWSVCPGYPCHQLFELNFQRSFHWSTVSHHTCIDLFDACYLQVYFKRVVEKCSPILFYILYYFLWGLINLFLWHVRSCFSFLLRKAITSVTAKRGCLEA